MKTSSRRCPTPKRRLRVLEELPFLGVCGSKRSVLIQGFTLHPQTDQAYLLIPTRTRLVWEAFSHATVTAQRLFIHAYPPLSVIHFIQLSEWRQPGSLLRVRRSNHSATTSSNQDVRNSIETASLSLATDIYIVVRRLARWQHGAYYQLQCLVTR